MNNISHFLISQEGLNSTSPVEHFLIDICQNSLHTTLLLCFILQGYIDDAIANEQEYTKRQTFLNQLRILSVSSFNRNERLFNLINYKDEEKRSGYKYNKDDKLESFHLFMENYKREYHISKDALLQHLDLPNTNYLSKIQSNLDFKSILSISNLFSENIDLKNDALKQVIKKIGNSSNELTDDSITKQTLIEGVDLNALMDEMDDQKRKAEFLFNQLSFVYGLTGISSYIKSLNFGKEKRLKQEKLNQCLEVFNQNLSKNVYVPFLFNGKVYRVINIATDEAKVLNSRDRVPFLIVFETICEDDIEQTKKELNESYQNGGKQEEKCIDEVISEFENVDGDGFLYSIFGNKWDKKKEELRAKSTSKYKYSSKWDIISMIVKSGDDLRQEQLAMSVIKKFHDIFKKANLPLWLYPYEIMAVSSTGGFIEAVHDSVSIHILKEKGSNTLDEFFSNAYHKPDDLLNAQINFVNSLAGYSLVCYILQIKDRHNGNILIDREGHLIHIDYGFILATSPGSLGYEKAHFKLTTEYIKVMELGNNQSMYPLFVDLFKRGYLELRKHCSDIITIIEMMMPKSNMYCFSKGEETLNALRNRFQMNLSDEDACKYAEQLIAESRDHWRTTSYDTFQRLTNNIKS